MKFLNCLLKILIIIDCQIKTTTFVKSNICHLYP